MLVLNLCRQLCPEKIPAHIKPERLGEGADGEVFELDNEPDKVIKFSILYDTGGQGLRRAYKYISNTLDYLIKQPSPAYAHVYAHMYLGEWSRSVVWGNTERQQKYLLYYYTMERLSKISSDEQKVFHTILSHEDRGIKKNFATDKLKETLDGLRKGLDFNIERVIFFDDILKKTPLAHLDIHVRNIMKDAHGNFKMIDFDRVQMGERNVKKRTTKD